MRVREGRGYVKSLHKTQVGRCRWVMHGEDMSFCTLGHLTHLRVCSRKVAWWKINTLVSSSFKVR